MGMKENHFQENHCQLKYPYYIESLRPLGSVLGLSSMRRLMEELGNPQDELPIIHIAGTNGKGSVSAFLASILMSAGFRVGQYISPTIKCYEERFQTNQKIIEKEDLEVYFSRVWEAISAIRQRGEESPTLFEAETAVAFLYFKKEKVDYVLLETGMGGSLDATNVIKTPLLSVITSVSLDHTQFLGSTLKEIASNKAGIIKPGCPVVISENKKEVVNAIEEKCKEMNSKLYKVTSRDYEVEEEGWQSSTFFYKRDSCERDSYVGEPYEIRLPGRHQISNAVTALMAAEVLCKEPDKGKRITKKAIREGLFRCRWPGRLEILSTDPIFIRDGAHNPDGARKLAEYVEKHFTNRSILYIIGVLGDKDYENMLAAILPTGSRLYLFTPQNARGLDAGRLAEAAKPYSLPTVICNHVKEAIKRAMADSGKDDVLILCGSLSFMEEMGEKDDNWRS